MVISVASQKGGTGKTTTSISLAAGLARRASGSSSSTPIPRPTPPKCSLRNYQDITAPQTLYATMLERKPLADPPDHVPNLAIVPSHILLSNTDIELTGHRPPRGPAQEPARRPSGTATTTSSSTVPRPSPG